jgi:hypothetical protein
MTLPSSGPLSIEDIANEFGGTAPHSLSEYYRGGSLVPDSSLTQSIPTSGLINVSDFYGTTNYTTLEILGQVTWVQNSTNDYFSSQSVSIPEGTKSVIFMGNIGTNGSRKTLHTTATLGGNALTEVISKNNSLAEYTFDSIIYAGNTSLTGTQTATFNYNQAQAVYGSFHIILFLNKEFNSFVASSSDSIATTTNPGSLSLTKYGEGIQLGAATVRPPANITNMPNLVDGFPSASNDRDYVFGYGITSGTYNESSTLNTAASIMRNDNGETFCAATFAPTKFNN